MPKYAVFVTADQTICYLTPKHMLTVIHKKAALFDTRKEAEEFATKHPGGIHKPECEPPVRGEDVYIEEVADVAEFHARPDTWEGTDEREEYDQQKIDEQGS